MKLQIGITAALLIGAATVASAQTRADAFADQFPASATTVVGQPSTPAFAQRIARALNLRGGETPN